MPNSSSASRFEAVDTGHIVARVCMSITFFMKDWRGHEREIVEAYRRIRPILDESIRWYRTAAMRSMRSVTRDTLDAPLAIENAPPRASYELTFTSGTTGDDVGPVTFYLSLPDSAKETEAGAFHLALPLDWVQDAEGFQALYFELAERLPFRSGLGGYATQVDEGEASRPANMACRRWLRQYDGIDCMHVIVATEFVLNKAKGVNWLTALDKSLAQRLGRIDRIRSQVPTGVQVHAVGNTVILQAGLRPLLLDKYMNDDRSFYAAVDAAIRPVLLRARVKFPAFADREETAEWLARFERPAVR